MMFMQFVDIKNDIAFRKIYRTPKFEKPLNELQEVTDKWIFFLKEAENLEVVPENVDDEGLKAAYQDANKHSWTKEELEAYDYAAMREQDERGKLVQAEFQTHKTILKMRVIIFLLGACFLLAYCTQPEKAGSTVDFEKENGAWKIAYLGFHYYPVKDTQ
jgi:hypothetical protein